MLRFQKARRAFLTSSLVFGSMTVTGFVSSQTPVQQPPAAPAGANPLDLYLQRWEAEMLKIQSLEARLKLVEVDKTFNTKETSLGVAKYTKVGAQGSQVSLALLELVKENRPTELGKKYICTGPFLYEILPQLKQIRAYEMPKPKPGQVGNDNFLLFLFGMKAEEVKRRYDIRLVKEDDYYGYFDIYPRTGPDKADFQRARLVLMRQNALPRQVWFEQPNGSETLWDIEKINPNAPVNPNEFEAPKVPQGWTTVVNPGQQAANGAGARMPRGNP